MAAERGVQVGLPQSLATFAGKFAPHAHFATTGVGAVKAELRQKVHDPELVKIKKSAEQLDVERVVESAQGVRQVPDSASLPPADMLPPPGYTLVQQHFRRVRGQDPRTPTPEPIRLRRASEGEESTKKA